jgi:hypothetical protein
MKSTTYLVTNKRDWINTLSSETAQAARDKEEWRHHLKIGDYIDALNFFETPQNTNSKHLYGWSPAKIILVDTQDNLLVSFLRWPKASHRKINRFSAEVAPTLTYTDDWHWRLEIKEDDVFDCADDYGNWYRSICLKMGEIIDQADVDGNSVP